MNLINVNWLIHVLVTSGMFRKSLHLKGAMYFRKANYIIKIKNVILFLSKNCSWSNNTYYTFFRKVYSVCKHLDFYQLCAYILDYILRPHNVICRQHNKIFEKSFIIAHPLMMIIFTDTFWNAVAVVSTI